ncbi:MAG: hypothetical protein JNL98_34330 [Bryobacterales bacterium]|nr:hypothetical protein [Bryobacterales bacterium]
MDNFAVTNNSSTAVHSGAPLGAGCGQGVNAPLAFLKQPSTSAGTFQAEFVDGSAEAVLNLGPSGPQSNYAQFVSQTVPTTMIAGQFYNVTIAFKNTGAQSWSGGGSYPHRLGSQNPQDNLIWGATRRELDAGETIQPGQTKTFSFQVAAPTNAGSYQFRWRMVQESVMWFGEYTPNVQITVAPPQNLDPIGYLDWITADGVAHGWSYDPNSSTSSNHVVFYVDATKDTGAPVASFATDVLRSDVNGYHGVSGTHGYDWIIPDGYRNGLSHQLRVYGKDLQTGSLTELTGSPKAFSLAYSSQAPLGYLDWITPDGTVHGWSFDPDSSTQSNEVAIYIDGTNSSGTAVATIAANVFRADVNAFYGILGNHGYDWPIPVEYRNAMPHTVRVYGKDIQTASLTELVGSPMAFTLGSANQNPLGYFDWITSEGVAHGWSFDPDSSSLPNQVVILINGSEVARFDTNVLRPDVNSFYGITGAHGYDWQVPLPYRNGALHTMRIYGVDRQSGNMVELVGSPKTFSLN